MYGISATVYTSIRDSNNTRAQPRSLFTRRVHREKIDISST